MTIIKNKYVGITHPIEGKMLDNVDFCVAWKITNCIRGIHVFDEVHSTEQHYLVCDICDLEVHIDHIVVPDEKDEVIE